VGRRQLPEKERDELRRKILRAASEIITKEGFEALSMRKLADRIGYSAGSIYLYFRNRDEIAKELSREGYSLLLEMMLKEKASKKAPPDELRALIRGYVRFGTEHPETYRLILMGDPVYLEAVFAEKIEDDPATQAYNLLVDAAQRLLAIKEDLSKITPVQLAESLWAAAHGLVSLKLTCPLFPTSTPEELFSVLTTMLFGKEPTDGTKLKRSR
jgi:AcrR family transcriptional regulator